MGQLPKISLECHKSQKNILFHLTFSTVNLTFGLSNDSVAQLVEQQTLNQRFKALLIPFNIFILKHLDKIIARTVV